jgi:hypothetical protein
MSNLHETPKPGSLPVFSLRTGIARRIRVRMTKTLSKCHTFLEGNWVRSAKMLDLRISESFGHFFASRPFFVISLVGRMPRIHQTHHSIGVKPAKKDVFEKSRATKPLPLGGRSCPLVRRV